MNSVASLLPQLPHLLFQPNNSVASLLPQPPHLLFRGTPNTSLIYSERSILLHEDENPKTDIQEIEIVDRQTT